MSRRPWMALFWLGSLTANGVALGQSQTSAGASAAQELPAGSTVIIPSARDAWASPDVAAPQFENDRLRRTRSPGPGTASAEANGTFSGLARTTASLAGVVGLIVLLAWGYRAVFDAGGRVGRRTRGPSAGLIQVLARTNLGPRQALCLVRVGPQLVLLGATQGSLSALAVVQDADLAARLAGQQEASGARDGEFVKALETESRVYDEPADIDAADNRAPLGAAKQRLADAVRRMARSSEPRG